MAGLSSGATTTTEVKIQEVPPTDASQNNASYVLGYTGDNLTTITKTIGGVSYQQTLTYSGSVLTDISAWVQL